MTTFDRFERSLPVLLEELAQPRVPDYSDDLLALTAASRQRPGWTFPERWFPMSAITQRFAAAPRIPWRLGVAVALLLLTALIGILVSGSRVSRPAPAFGPATNGLIPYTYKGDLYVGDPKTGTTRVLITGPNVAAFPGFAPDGTRLAFLRVVADSSPQTINVYTMKPDGSDVHLATPTPIDDADWRQISWTADSRHIGVVHPVDGVSQLDVFDISGSAAPRRLAPAAGLTWFAFRPPAGGEILFRGRANSSGGVDYGLYAMDADGTNVRLVLKANAPPSEGDTLDLTDVSFTPDGSRIFFNRWTPGADHKGAGGCCRLFVANADGTDEHQFIPNPGNAWDGKATVSPDGNLVAFLHGLNDGSFHGVAVIRADGTGPIVATGPEIGSSNWIWSPDSSTILLRAQDNAASTTFLLDPAGGPWKTAKWQGDNDIDWQRVAP
jgi:Tol biopolymer transport system component